MSDQDGLRRRHGTPVAIFILTADGDPAPAATAAGRRSSLHPPVSGSDRNEVQGQESL